MVVDFAGALCYADASALRRMLSIFCDSYATSHGLIFNANFALSRSVVGPGARKPSVGEEIESRRPLVCSFCLFSPVYTYTGVLNNNKYYTTATLLSINDTPK